MKKYIYIGILFAGTLISVGCEKEVDTYNSPECYLNFDLGNPRTVEQTYSFVYHGDVTEDTVWLKMTTLGFVSDKERSFDLVQVKTDDNDAVAGQHYLSFDNEELKRRFYYVPGGAVEVKIPVVLFRDASLKKQVVTLKVAVKENEFFKPGYEADKYSIISFSDMLAKPSNWDAYNLYYYMSVYSKGLHQFLIDATGEKWDDEYIEYLCSDKGYMQYMIKWGMDALEKENAQRIQNGQDILREENGDPVKFNPSESPTL